jgi:sialidase-1
MYCTAPRVPLTLLLLTLFLFPVPDWAGEPAKVRAGGMTPMRLFAKQGKRFFRIPGIAVSKEGTLLAFAGERKGSIGDFGHDTDVVVRRSTDGGVTWTATETILAEKDIDFHSGPVVADGKTGAIFKFARSHGAKTKAGTDWRENYVLRSDDDGKTWAKSVLDLKHVRASHRFGPGNGGHGIQLADGRLVIQGGYMRRDGKKTTMSLCLIESRDHGESWQIMKGSDLDNAHVEFCIAETVAGQIYFNSREITGPERLFGALNVARPAFFTLAQTTGLPGARCRAGMVAVREKDATRLYYTGPTGLARRSRYDEAARVDLTLFCSDSEGRKWERLALIHKGKAAYSDLAVLPDGDLVCVYETGDSRPDEEVVFVRIPRKLSPDGGSMDVHGK